MMREEAIRRIENHIRIHSKQEPFRACHIQEALEMAIDALKAQEPETLDAPKPDSNVGCWYDITHNYTLEQVVSALKLQESVAPLLNIDTLECRKCGHILENQELLGDNVLFYEQYNYYPNCGQAVKWDG